MKHKIEEAPQARTGRGFNNRDNRIRSISNPTEAQRQERNLDEILTCWRWARSLDHRLNVYQLQFEHDVAGALAGDLKLPPTRSAHSRPWRKHWVRHEQKR
jgi:hypothetical protein